MPSHNKDTQRTKLATEYERLNPSEKAVVQLMSIIYEPVSRSNILSALSYARISMDGGRPFAPAECRQVLGRLEERGLLHNVKNIGISCHKLIAETATRDALRSGRFKAMAAAAEKVSPIEMSYGYYYPRGFDQGMRVLRLRLYQQDAEKLWRMLDTVFRIYPSECQSLHPLLRVCNTPFDAEWFATLPDAIAGPVLWTILEESFDRMKPSDEAFAFLQRHWSREDDKDASLSYRALLTEQSIWRGRLEEASELTRQEETPAALLYRATLDFLRGSVETALEGYEETLKRIKQVTGKRNAEFPGRFSVFYVLSLIQTRDSARLDQAQKYLRRFVSDKSRACLPSCTVLLSLVETLLGMRGSKASYYAQPQWPEGCDSFDLLAVTLALHWMDSKNLELFKDALVARQAKAVTAGYDWWAAEAAAVLAQLRPEPMDYIRQAQEFHQRAGTRSIVEVLRKQEPWERGLAALEHVAETSKAVTGASVRRLAWCILLSGGMWRLEPREVKQLQSGGWTKGKAVALKRLCTQREQFPYLTPQDIAICGHIAPEIDRYSYYGSHTYYDLAPRALLALAGHPMVFGAEGGHLEVVKGDPELRVSKKGKRVIIELTPALDPEQEVALVQETNTRLKVIECTPAHRRMADIIGAGLHVPVEHQARVLEALGRVASLITVHSDIGGGLENVPEVPADARPHVILLPTGDGLRVQILVRPLAEGGAYYRSGAGGETVMAEVGGRRVQTHRNLKLEKELAAHVLARCQTLERAAESDGEWRIEDPEECLELLDELQGAGGDIVVEWPQGEKMRVSHRASFANLQLKVLGNRNWFEATGQLQLDENRVLDMRQLLDLIDQTPGRFVPLGEGQYLALTKEFRKRLDELRAVSEAHGKGVRFHPLAAPTVESFLEDAGTLKTDKVWKQYIERFREAQSFTPTIPTTLRATLRDYQVEGHQWLARLAHWGAGACLADDMGLGKTVQALALMLSHAAEGPGLVVAPTSVCMNWIDEARRFSPTLNPILFGAGDRQETLDALKPFDLLVCSYGLLYQEDKKLAAVRWRVAVLDEAQAIKNVTTRRSQAAMNLQADFRLITTGTPIENHLGELWNLFRFINPGLLGSLEHFNQRFATPIEKRQDREARSRLKKVIQPFILRRVKEQVLEELPSRTEITLHIEFSEEEAAFYEALRQQAVQRIASTSGTAGQKHLQILAEIMRLRRACCNAGLVAPDVAISSSKLKVFLDLVDELLDNRHKALVFSQFVDHLSILRERLDERGVRFQYLDGSTPQRERKRRVDAFQAGEGDLFLISLKAGGLGLNLTAADYVIHMDPWWNPAVEDQASDRAHRIGQQRPVTIYRLVTKDTIESKIVDLHRHKRDLADSLLEGAEMTGKMSADELLALLQESR